MRSDGPVHPEGVSLTLTVDGEGVVRATAVDGGGEPVKAFVVTAEQLGRLLTGLHKAIIAQEGDDVSEVHLN